MTDMKIGHTLIGREYGWDRLSDVDLVMLQGNREAKMRVINKPHQFPLADFDACREMVKAIDLFMFDYGDLLAEFA